MEPSPASTRRSSRHLVAAALEHAQSQQDGRSIVIEAQALETQTVPDVTKAAFLAALSRIERSSPQGLAGRGCDTKAELSAQ